MQPSGGRGHFHSLFSSTIGCLFIVRNKVDAAFLGGRVSTLTVLNEVSRIPLQEKQDRRLSDRCPRCFRTNVQMFWVSTYLPLFDGEPLELARVTYVCLSSGVEIGSHPANAASWACEYSFVCV